MQLIRTLLIFTVVCGGILGLAAALYGLDEVWAAFQRNWFGQFGLVMIACFILVFFLYLGQTNRPQSR